MTSEEAAVSFVKAINAGDLEELTGLMTGDHVFIGSDGTEYPGRDELKFNL